MPHEAEYYALRGAAALIDISPLFKYEVSGPAAAQLLNRVMTRDIGRCAVGQVMYSPWCNDDGKMVDDGTISRLSEDRFRVTAAAVVSSLDPQRTFFGMLGAHHLPLRFARRIRNLRMRGGTAKVNLALRDRPRFTEVPEDELRLSGHLLVCPTLEYLEQAHDAAKYGRIPRHPVLDILIPTILDPSLAPAGRHSMSIDVQFAPFELQRGTWGDYSQPLLGRVLDTMELYSPGIRDLILHQQVLTPQDWQQQYGLTAGAAFHVDMALDQMLFMRPVPGAGRYATPIDRLFLCGAGIHPGGGVTGAPGFNAAREINRIV